MAWHCRGKGSWGNSITARQEQGHLTGDPTHTQAGQVTMGSFREAGSI